MSTTGKNDFTSKFWRTAGYFVETMQLIVLRLDGAHVRSNLSYLICFRHLIRSKAVTNMIFFSPKRPIFFHACATCFELPSHIRTMHAAPDSDTGTENLNNREGKADVNLL